MTSPPRDPQAPLSTGQREPDVDVAASPHHLASQAALDVMHDGGSAVDGAIAADAVLAVVAPDTCGPGGDLFAIVHRPGDERPTVLNASGRAGSGASAAELRDAGHDSVPMRSHWSITVPGCVDGWQALIGRFGSLRLRDVLEPAIRLATDGLPVSRELAASLRRMHDLVADQASAHELYPDGAAPSPGAVLHRPALGRTLEAVADGGREAFYDGPVGAGIIAATGGVITRGDLDRRQVEWVKPASTPLFGLTAWTVPPNSQGWITLAALRIFESLSPPRDPEDPAYQHALIEAYRSVAWERADTTSDPATAPMTAAELLAEERIADRAGRIDAAHAQGWPSGRRAPGGTAYLATRDRNGMAVSFIQSNFWGIGSGISAGATGVWLHNRGAGFDLRAGHPNELLPGRRPLHTLAPTLWTVDGATRLVLGTRGGDQQPQLLAQVAANHLWAGRSPDEALASPRWTIEDIASDGLPAVRYEPRYPVATIAGLDDRGHALTPSGPWEPGWGPVSMITVGSDSVRADADPRVSTATALARK